jgi:hypothetical protein
MRYYRILFWFGFAASSLAAIQVTVYLVRGVLSGRTPLIGTISTAVVVLLLLTLAAAFFRALRRGSRSIETWMLITATVLVFLRVLLEWIRQSG